MITVFWRDEKFLREVEDVLGEFLADVEVRWTPFSLGKRQHVDCLVEVKLKESEECGNSVHAYLFFRWC